MFGLFIPSSEYGKHLTNLDVAVRYQKAREWERVGIDRGANPEGDMSRREGILMTQ